MLKGIDHLVIVVPDLPSASKSYQALGFTVVPGGRHPVGTHNALIAFGDGAYIELIAFYERNPEHKWWMPLQRGGGLVDFCMQTDDLLGDTAAFRQAGVEIDDPSPLSRVRPDGYQLKWVLSIRSEEHTSELQSLAYLVCRLLLEKKKNRQMHQGRAPHT